MFEIDRPDMGQEQTREDWEYRVKTIQNRPLNTFCEGDILRHPDGTQYLIVAPVMEKFINDWKQAWAKAFVDAFPPQQTSEKGKG